MTPSPHDLGTFADRLAAARRRLGRFRYLDAPLLAALAAGFHFYWNVPDQVVAVPGDQGVPKPKRKKPRPARHEPRPPAALAGLAERYARRPFTAEPKNDAFARYAVPRLRRVVSLARREAFEGAPAPTPLRTVAFECRTVRCRFRVERATGPHEVNLLVEALRGIAKDGAPVFRTVHTTPAVAPEGDEGYAAWIEVTLARDDFDRPMPRPRSQPPPAAAPPAKRPRSAGDGA